MLSIIPGRAHTATHPQSGHAARLRCHGDAGVSIPPGTGRIRGAAASNGSMVGVQGSRLENRPLSARLRAPMRAPHGKAIRRGIPRAGSAQAAPAAVRVGPDGKIALSGGVAQGRSDLRRPRYAGLERPLAGACWNSFRGIELSTLGGRGGWNSGVDRVTTAFHGPERLF